MMVEEIVVVVLGVMVVVVLQKSPSHSKLGVLSWMSVSVFHSVDIKNPEFGLLPLSITSQWR